MEKNNDKQSNSDNKSWVKESIEIDGEIIYNDFEAKNVIKEYRIDHATMYSNNYDDDKRQPVHKPIFLRPKDIDEFIRTHPWRYNTETEELELLSVDKMPAKGTDKLKHYTHVRTALSQEGVKEAVEKYGFSPELLEDVLSGKKNELVIYLHRYLKGLYFASNIKKIEINGAVFYKIKTDNGIYTMTEEHFRKHKLYYLISDHRSWIKEINYSDELRVIWRKEDKYKTIEGKLVRYRDEFPSERGADGRYYMILKKLKYKIIDNDLTSKNIMELIVEGAKQNKDISWNYVRKTNGKSIEEKKMEFKLKEKELLLLETRLLQKAKVMEAKGLVEIVQVPEK